MSIERYRVRLTGCTFDNRQDYLRELKRKNLADTSVRLLREPQNPYDPNAISVLALDKLPAKIGYFPRNIAAYFADKMDRGIPLTANNLIITGGTNNKPLFGCSIDIEIGP